MTRVPDSELVLVPGGTLITATADEGRALAFTLARHSIHNIQPDLDVLVGGPAHVREQPRQPHRRLPGGRDRVPDDRCRQQLLAPPLSTAAGGGLPGSRDCR